ncbi:bifunctional diguanylate cyclase/phosphodiesterase [Pseudomarimonas arenosa]|uniref:EAL domain-containing protein n=1 Tax=Pseudomarimonas arenosa TaxID=2774145 RepID=A0AAW3ZLV8_9GAMM|nr:EAL domain-containing protein [Pseudomarimonas arenosa]MBD8527041.1 EAL domain-containing protein [Pseudomarimonas arenosa]
MSTPSPAASSAPTPRAAAVPGGLARAGWLRSPTLAAAAVLALSLAIMLSAAIPYREALLRDRLSFLPAAAGRVGLSVLSELKALGQAARSVQVGLENHPDMTQAEFDRLVDQLKVRQNFASVMAVAFARKQVDEFGRDHYYTELIAPEAGNERLRGLDVISQSNNLEALERALRSDEPTLSAPFRLVQYGQRDHLIDGIVMRLPVLGRNNGEMTTEHGSLAVSFQLSRLIDGATRQAGTELPFELQLWVADQAGQLSSVYSSAVAGVTAHGATDLGEFAQALTFGGAHWQLRLIPLPGAVDGVDRALIWFVGFGLLASFGFSAFVWAQVRTRRQSERLAERMFASAQQSEQRFKQLSELLPTATLMADEADGSIDYVNVAGRNLLRIGAENQSVVLHQLLPRGEPDLAALSASDMDLVDALNLDADEHRVTVRALDGRDFEASWRETRLLVGNKTMRLVVIEDITERTQLTTQLRYQATHDSVTGLFNRREFDRRLHQRVEHSAATGRIEALLYVDLDQFKLVNDTCGHLAGDQLLVDVAATLRRCVGADGWVARLGGDEFGIMMRAASVAEIRSAAERVRGAIEMMDFRWEERRYGLTASIGAVAIDGGRHVAPRELLAFADTACYLAKEAGRNRVVVHEENRSSALRRRAEMDWIPRIRQALAEDRLLLCYQELRPLRDEDKQRGAHFELLVRLRDEQGNIVPPGAFIPAAERFGVMPEIDRWVVSYALRHFSRLHPQGDDIGMCAINLSGATMSDESFPQFLLELLKSESVRPERLCFEITETAAVTHFDRACALIRSLQALGCKVALDDFGAGMSSFGYLKNLPIDYLKIDGSFIREIETDAMSQSIVRAVTEIGHRFKTRVVAEFVPGPSACDVLSDIGVDFAQGFAIHVPHEVVLDRAPESHRETTRPQ